MTVQEFSNEFDILYNQVNSNQAPGLDEYEKSVFLTKAQDEIVLAYFNPRGNKHLQGMDESNDKQYDFSMLIRNGEADLHNNSWLSSGGNPATPFDPRSVIAVMDKDVLLVINESVVKKNGSTEPVVFQVIPIPYYEYTRVMQKPYKYPPKNCVWRLIMDSYLQNNNSTPTVQNDVYDEYVRVELINPILNTEINNNGSIQYRYKYRFVKRPTPIILVNLSSANLSIHGYSTQMSCQLAVPLHSQILQRAVELATAVYNPQALGNIVGVGNASATNLGILPSKNDKQ